MRADATGAGGSTSRRSCPHPIRRHTAARHRVAARSLASGCSRTRRSDGRTALVHRRCSWCTRIPKLPVAGAEGPSSSSRSTGGSSITSTTGRASALDLAPDPRSRPTGGSCRCHGPATSPPSLVALTTLTGHRRWRSGSSGSSSHATATNCSNHQGSSSDQKAIADEAQLPTRLIEPLLANLVRQGAIVAGAESRFAPADAAARSFIANGWRRSRLASENGQRAAQARASGRAPRIPKVSR